MWALVLGEVENLDVALGLDGVADEETGTLQVVQHGADIDIVVGEGFGLDPLRAIFQAPFPIGQHPEVDEQKTLSRNELGQVFVGHDGRLDIPGSRHYDHLVI
ncbi:hypothetical protein D3C81_1665160 [compost metagenome]